MNVGERIRERREHLGLSQEGAAAKAGISASTWQDYEYDTRGKRFPSTKRKVAAALDWPVNFDELLARGVDPAEITAPLVDGAITASDFDDAADNWLLEARVRRLEQRVDRLITLLSTPGRSINHPYGEHNQYGSWSEAS